MEKKILFRDEKKIEEIKRTYEGKLPMIQSVIDGLINQSVPLTEEACTMLLHGNSAIENWVASIIDTEVSKFPLKPMQEAMRRELEVFYRYTNEAQSKLREIIQHANVGDVYTSSGNYVFSGTQVGMKAGFMDHYIEEFTVYCDTPEKERAYQLATDLVAKINELQELTESAGECSQVFTSGSIYGRQGIIAMLDGKAKINYHGIAVLNNKRMKL